MTLTPEAHEQLLDLSPIPSDPLSDFRNFLYLVWKYLGLTEPTPIQYDIAAYLQDGPKRSITEAFRGVGKSWITSAFACWLLRRDPQLKILVVSASKNRADDFTTFTRRLIQEMPQLQHLRPQSGQRDAKISFDVGPALAAHAPSIKSVGITGQLAGSRAEIIIADDIEIPNNSQTQAMRDKLSESVKEFDAILKPVGKIIYLGTPQTEMSLYNQLPARGYKTRVWPARYPTPTQMVNMGGMLAPLLRDAVDNKPDLAGRSTDPQRFSDFNLMERELSYGRSGFALQFMLDTRLSDAHQYPLRVEDLIVMSLNPDNAPEKPVWATSPALAIDDLPNVALAGDHYYLPMQTIGDWLPYTGSVMAIDPSGRGKDELGYAVVKHLNGYLYLTKSGGLQGGYSPETLQHLAAIAKEQKVNQIIIESNFGDGMFSELLKPVLGRIYPCAVEEVRHSTQKEKRIIDTLEPVMNQHRLVVDRRVIQHDYESTQSYPVEDQLRYQLIHQLTRITRERGALSHDDRLDALAIAVNYWVESMARDADRAVGERQEDLIRDELERLWASIESGDSVYCDTSAQQFPGEICNISQHNSYNLLN